MLVHQTRTVLAVDDDISVLTVLQHALTHVGYRVLVAGNGLEALSQFELHGDAIDLLITDLQMPQMGGSDLARRLRQMHPDLPIIFISGDPETEALVSAEAFSNHVYMRKPFLPSDLVAQVPKLLELNI